MEDVPALGAARSEMTPEYWRRVKLALDAILELPPGRRQAYLVEVSARDPELGREVLSSMSELTEY